MSQLGGQAAPKAGNYGLTLSAKRLKLRRVTFYSDSFGVTGTFFIVDGNKGVETAAQRH